MAGRMRRWIDRITPSWVRFGLHRRRHIRILQLDRQPLTVERARLVHLAEGGGGRRRIVEFGEFRAPVAPKLRLQRGEFGCVFGRDGVGNGGEKLGDLHQRPFQPAKHRRQFLRVAIAIAPAANEPGARDTGRKAADLRIAPDTCGKPVGPHGRADDAYQMSSIRTSPPKSMTDRIGELRSTENRSRMPQIARPSGCKIGVTRAYTTQISEMRSISGDQVAQRSPMQARDQSLETSDRATTADPSNRSVRSAP